MEPERLPQSDENIARNVTAAQLEHFTGSDPRCRALQLPDGLLLRYNLSASLYFYLRTGVKDGKITTRIFASDSPYDWQKICIGEIRTPMFEQKADARQLQAVQQLLWSWVGFVAEENDSGESFRAFTTGDSESRLKPGRAE